MALSQACERAFTALNKSIMAKNLEHKSDHARALSMFVELHKRGERPTYTDVERWFRLHGDWSLGDVHILARMPETVAFIMDNHASWWQQQAVDRWLGVKTTAIPAEAMQC